MRRTRRRTLVHHCRQQSVGAHCCWGKRSTQVFASSTSIAAAFDFDGCKKIINKEPRKGKECPPGSPQYSVVVPCPYNIGSINALKSIPFQALTGHQSTISPLNSYFIGEEGEKGDEEDVVGHFTCPERLRRRRRRGRVSN